MIRIEDLSFSYGNTRILKDINLEAEAGKLVALIGPNGAGKSTLFKCIMKFLRNYEGRVLLDGQDMREMSRAEIAGKIAYIPQTTIPVFNYDVIDIVLMGMTGGLRLLETPKRKHVEKAEAVLEELGIAHLRNRGFGRISGGERQLVMLARAIVQDAGILIMDEPTANLDYGNQLRVMERIHDLAGDGYTVILSTHNPDHALLFADLSFVLQDGRVRAAGPSAQVLSEELMHELYKVDVKLMDYETDGSSSRVCVPVRKGQDRG